MKLRIYADYGHFTAYYCHYFFVLLQDIECYSRILCKYLHKILYKRHRKSGQHVAAFFMAKITPIYFDSAKRRMACLLMRRTPSKGSAPASAMHCATISVEMGAMLLKRPMA